jgi:hypothetical protein
MADINQATTADSVHFWSGSPKGDDWMKTRYESVDVTFDLPADTEIVKAFRTSAEAAGLTFQIL